MELAIGNTHIDCLSRLPLVTTADFAMVCGTHRLRCPLTKNSFLILGGRIDGAMEALIEEAGGVTPCVTRIRGRRDLRPLTAVVVFAISLLICTVLFYTVNDYGMRPTFTPTSTHISVSVSHLPSLCSLLRPPHGHGFPLGPLPGCSLPQ